MKVTREVYIGFSAGVLIGALVMYAALSFRGTLTNTSSSSGPSASTKATDTLAHNALDSAGLGGEDRGYALRTFDQPAGEHVSVSYRLPEEAWIAIREDNNGASGRILGARLFAAGSGSGEIPLLRPTVPGSTYQALLYRDNGNRQFEYHVDLLIMSAVNAPIESTFQVNGGSAGR